MGSELREPPKVQLFWISTGNFFLPGGHDRFGGGAVMEVEGGAALGYEDLNSVCQAMYFSARVFPEALTLLLAACTLEQKKKKPMGRLGCVEANAYVQ